MSDIKTLSRRIDELHYSVDGLRADIKGTVRACNAALAILGDRLQVVEAFVKSPMLIDPIDLQNEGARLRMSVAEALRHAADRLLAADPVDAKTPEESDDDD